MVLGDDGPSVAQQLHVAPPGVDHRLDSEGHAGFEFEAGARLTVMKDLGVLVEDPADPVAAVLANDRIALALDKGLDGVAEVAEAGPRADGTDAAPHGLEPDVAQPPGLDRGVTDQEHAAGVALDVVLDDGDVLVEDVARPQDLVAR